MEKNRSIGKNVHKICIYVGKFPLINKPLCEKLEGIIFFSTLTPFLHMEIEGHGQLVAGEV